MITLKEQSWEKCCQVIWKIIEFIGRVGIKAAKGTLIIWALFVTNKKQKEDIRDYWVARWKQTCLPWSANAKYISCHWKKNKGSAKSVVTEVSTGSNAPCELLKSEWAVTRLLAAAGELLVNGGAGEVIKLLWKLQDPFVFRMFGDWLCDKRFGRAAKNDVMNLKT